MESLSIKVMHIKRLTRNMAIQINQVSTFFLIIYINLNYLQSKANSKLDLTDQTWNPIQVFMQSTYPRTKFNPKYSILAETVFFYILTVKLTGPKCNDKLGLYVNYLNTQFKCTSSIQTKVIETKPFFL